MDWLIERLRAPVLPDEPPRIVHDDYRLENRVLGAGGTDVIALLGWELSTLGHPLADFAYNAMLYRLPADITSGLRDADLKALGIPGDAEYLGASANGRTPGRWRRGTRPFASRSTCSASPPSTTASRAVWCAAMLPRTMRSADSYPVLARLALETSGTR